MNNDKLLGELMDHVHIRNLEKYHPKYKDRKLQWAKIYFDMVQGDPDCELITNEIDWGRLVKFILLELQAKKPIPLDKGYLTKKGFDLKKRPIKLTIEMLHNFIEIVPKPCRRVREEKEKEEEEEEDSSDSKLRYATFESSVVSAWNRLSEKIPSIPAIREITEKRRSALKQRFTQKTFMDFPAILDAIEEQPFLLGKNDRNWTVSIDWLISNDTNHVKVLERKYKNNAAQADNLKTRLGL